MKKLLLGLGTLTAVAVPTVAVVSCSLGSVFKSKINSLGEAKKDLGKIFSELSKNGKLNSDIDKYTSELTAQKVMNLYDGIKSDELKGMTIELDNLELKQGQRVHGYGDWLGTHNDYYSQVKGKLANGDDVYVSVFFKYDKTNGPWTTGRKSFLLNAAIGAANLATPLKHVISDITISKVPVFTPFI